MINCLTVAVTGKATENAWLPIVGAGMLVEPRKISPSPKPDGSIPEESVQIFTEVGQWLAKNGGSIYSAEKCQPNRSRNGSFTRKGNTLYFHIHYYPGSSAAFAGLMTKAISAHLLASGKSVDFVQDKYSINFTGLPPTAPDHPVTTIAIECESIPTQDNIFVRNRERGKV